MTPAMRAPTIGATIKTQSWLRAAPPAKRAGAIERAGLTEVLVTGIEMRWITVSVRPMARGAKTLGGEGVGGAEDDDHEHGGEDELGDEGGGEAEVLGGVGAVAVCGEAGGGVEAGSAGGDGVEDGGAGDATDELGGDVGRDVLPGQTAGDGEAEADGGVEVATGDVAEPVGHGGDGEAEGEGDADVADAHE